MYDFDFKNNYLFQGFVHSEISTNELNAIETILNDKFHEYGVNTEFFITVRNELFNFDGIPMKCFEAIDRSGAINRILRMFNVDVRKDLNGTVYEQTFNELTDALANANIFVDKLSFGAF